jgi:hypothetical protein
MMNKTNLAILCALVLGTAVGCAERTETFADSVCSDLRAQRPDYAGPIGVTCRWPGVTTYFGCKALDGSHDGVPIDAEAIDPGCARPWGV